MSPNAVNASVRVTAALPRLTLAGRAGARVVGGLVDPNPEWGPVGAAMLARIPEEARSHVRAWRLPAAVHARLAGPVHSGHGVAVDAVHSEFFAGGRALELARWPNEGFAEIGELVDPGSAPRNGWDDVPLARRVIEPDRGGVFVPADRTRAARWARAAASAPWAAAAAATAATAAAASPATAARMHRRLTRMPTATLCAAGFLPRAALRGSC